MIDRQIVVAKKEHVCFGCLRKIQKGEIYKSRQVGLRKHPLCRKCAYIQETG